MEADNIIRAELVPTHGYFRLSCHCCGGTTEKHLVATEVPKSHPKHAGFRICERCLEAGNANEQLLEHAAELEQRAAELRDMAGRLRVPTLAEWKRADDFLDALVVLAQLGEDGDLPNVTAEDALAWPVERQREVIRRARDAYERNSAKNAAQYAEPADDLDDGEPF